MVCRNFEKVYVVVEEIKKIIGNEKVVVKELDFVLLKFVRNFVEEVYYCEDCLDIFINNVGIM